MEDKKVSAKIHESVKRDFTLELREAENKLKSYKETIVWLCKQVDCVQETEALKARVLTLIEKETFYQNVVDNRPHTRNPFDGLGELIKGFVANADKLIKLLIKKLKNGKTIPRMGKDSV